MIDCYTDASIKHGRGGFGCVFMDTDEPEILYELSGRIDSINSPFRAELVAVTEAMCFMADIIDESSKVRISCDCLFLCHTYRKSRNLLMAKHNDLWSQVIDFSRDFDTSITWIPGHSGIHMNERADKLARKGAGIYG